MNRLHFSKLGKYVCLVLDFSSSFLTAFYGVSGHPLSSFFCFCIAVFFATLARGFIYCQHYYEDMEAGVTRNHRPKGYRHKDNVDLDIVKGLMDGDIPPANATATEKRMAIEWLHEKGFSDTHISQQTGIPRTSVQRIRRVNGMPANYPRGRPKEGD